MLTESEIQTLAADWYKKLDVHAPLVEILPLLADEGLEMVFPEATVRGLAGFEGWYERVIRIFFDEVHTLKLVSAEIGEDSASVHVVVDWAASVWSPPEAKSARIMLDADQTWVVKRSLTSGKPMITSYTVNSLSYHEGSAKL
ncbi:MAG: hypothetical protein K9J77_02350 [Rhodoferax sp.]|nr:hypothetical protein [Rhodoferax sp.]